MTVGQKLLPSDSPLASLRVSELAFEDSVDRRVFRPSDWLSPFTGAGLLGLFDLGFSPALSKNPYAADYFFILKARESYDSGVSSLYRLWLSS